MFIIIIDTFFRKMKLDRESLDFKYVSDEMSNLSLAQEYPTVFKIQGTLSCLLYIFTQILSCKIILHVFVICSYFFRITLLLMQFLLGIASVSKCLNSALVHFVGLD